MRAPRKPAAPVWLLDSVRGSITFVDVEDNDIPSGTVLERPSGSNVLIPWDGHGQPACAVLVGYVAGQDRFARAVLRNAKLIGRHLRSGSLGRRGCPPCAREDLSQWRIEVV